MNLTEFSIIFLGGAASGALPFLLWILIRCIIARSSQQEDTRYWRSRHLFIR